MTVQYYDEYPYLDKSEAKVTDTGSDKTGNYIVLDRTIFFPEEGGQTPDKGSINGVPVVYSKKHDACILHYLEDTSSFDVGDTVSLELDWDHRYKNMQMHTAEHIFSGLVNSKFGYNNVGFHLSDNSATMDYDGKLTKEDVLMLEEETNRIIYKDIAVHTGYPSKEELSNMQYRLKKELSGPIRIVSIEGVDSCACCAPHVKSTGEIGVFKIVSFENYKGGTRIHYLAGFRAFCDYREKSESIKSISEYVSAKPGEEASKVSSLAEEYRKATLEILTLKNKIVEARIASECSGEKDIIFFTPKDETSLMKYTMDTLHKYYPGTCALFAGSDKEGYRYFIEDNERDLAGLNQLLKDKFSAKGGGKPHSIQGTLIGNEEKIIWLIQQNA